jgi:hypothetical protein
VSHPRFVQLRDPQTKQRKNIGCYASDFTDFTCTLLEDYASEEDAARAYDCAAVQKHGPGVKRNFPGETISELPATMGGERKQRCSSRYFRVSWEKRRSSWYVQLNDPQTKRQQHVGYFASEEDAGRAYDCAAVQKHGPGVKRNFPGEAISELPVAACLGEKRKQRSPALRARPC